MALGADLDVELGLRGPGDELVAARAVDSGDDVVGMDFGLHQKDQDSKGAACSRAAEIASESTSRWVTKRTVRRSSAAARTPAAASSSTSCWAGVPSVTVVTTMFVCTSSGST